MSYLKINIGKTFSLQLGREGSTDKTPISVNKLAPPSQYNGAIDGTDFFKSLSMLSTSANVFDISSASTIVKAVNECPQVSIVVFKRAANQANGITTVCDVEGNELKKGMEGEWKRVIDQPHAMQSRSEFTMLRAIFLLTYGYCFEYKEIPFGFRPDRMQRRILDPANCEIIFKKRPLFGITSQIELIDKFYYTENDVRVEILPEYFPNLYCYTNPNILRKAHGFLPESPLKTLKYPINNSINNYKSRFRMLRGPIGAVSGKGKDETSAIPLTPKEQEELKQSWRDNWGVENEGQIEMVLSPTEVTFTPFMYPVKDLQMLELLKSDSATICDRLGYEYDLLARDQGGVALNNKNEAGKNQYQNSEIPFARNLDEQEIESLAAFGFKYKIKTSFEHLPVLQEDLKQKADTLRVNVTALREAFMTSMCSYDDMVTRAGISELNKRYTGKWWHDLTPGERELFITQNKNIKDESGNEETNSGGNKGINKSINKSES